MFRKLVIGLLATVAVGSVFAVTASATPQTEKGDYPGLLKVTEVQGDTVVGVDANGFLWDFVSEGNDYDVNDLVSVIYDNKKTEIIFDDEIIQARYVGTTEMYQ